MTCAVNSHRFTQRFKRVDGAGPWVVMDQPNGPCGVINVSRFERPTGSTFPVWNYRAKKVVTNPGGELMPRFSCSDLDEREFVYDWRSEEKFLNCNYIKFGPL